jgi:hypothetical protein
MRKLPYLLLLLLAACDYGSPLENQAPETQLFVESINLSGLDRLKSIVRVRWTGEDIDGYVKGYEISQDGSNWDFVTKTDSTFQFDLPFGVDTADIDFFVRAVDNQDLIDPSPAYLLLPIRNSPPEARFDTANVVPDLVYSVWSTPWAVGDLDGLETLDSVFIRINDGAWHPLEPQTNFASFVPTDPTSSGPQSARLFLGAEGIEQDALIEGLVVGDTNRMYLKARDISGSESKIDSTKAFFVRRQTADLLVIDAQAASAADDVYFPILNKVYASYDYLNLLDNLPPFWNPTFGLTLELYDKVFWYSDGTQQSGLGSQLAMEVASTQIQNYLNQGGKIFFSAKFPNPFPNAESPNQSTIFGFSPMDSLSSSSGQARLAKDSLAVPQGNFASSFPPLVSGTFITGADPFYPKDPNNDLYRGQLTAVGGWIGPATIAGRTVFTNGRTNQVFFSVELHKLNGDLNALEQCFDLILNQEFNW